MAKYANLVEYNIKTNLDASGITKLQSELTKVQTVLNNLSGSPNKMRKLGLNVDEVQLYQDQIEKLGRTISNCFNSRTGMLNLNQFNTALKSGTLSVSELNGAFKAAGTQGKTAFNSMVTMMTNVNKQAVTVNSTMAKIANTFSNTVRWGITASIFQEMMGSVQGAVSYMKNLDESLTQIQMVTNSSKENMRELAQYANNAAQALGSTTVDYTNAVKVFVQEGFSESESKQYANLSTKLANVSEQSTAVTSDQITAFRNAFQLSYEETVAAMDKVANVANNTASNVNELMTASQRAASVAQAVGSSQDSFLAAIATIESVTRQSAEEIGNGLKTIYQRFADIKVSGKTEDGVDYGQYANALKQIGVDVLDAAGEFKGMDQILKETQEVWSSLSDTMKVAVGEKVAGKFQYNRFAALMNNQAYYEKALAATGAGSEGMMDQMNEIYMESIEGRLKTLQAAGEQVMSTLFDQDTVEPIIEDVTEFVNGLNTIIEVAGGGIPIFTALSALLLKAFSPQIAAQITQIATNIATISQAANNMKNMDAAMMMAGQMGRGLDSKTYDVASRGMSVVQGLDQVAQEKMSAIVQQMAEAEERVEAAESKVNEIASQLVTKYQKQLSLTEEQAAEMQIVLANSIKNNESQNQIRASIKDTLGIEEESLEVIRLTRTETNSMAQAYKEMGGATLSVNQNLNAANTAIESFKSEQIARGFTQALSAVTSLAFGVQSMVSWWKIMNDETASFEEKMNATLISLTMGLSMLGSAVTSLRSGWQAIATGLGITEKAVALQAYKKSIVEVTAAYEVYQKTLISGTEKEHLDALAHYENAIAIRQEAAAKVAATGATEVNSKATLKNVIVTAEESLAKKLDTKITIEGTAANAIYATSLKAIGLSGVEATAGVTTLGSAVTAFALPVIAITELIGLLVLTYKAWEEAIHAANKQYEQQTEILKDIKENYNTAKESIDQLKNSIDSLTKKQDDLDGLAKGTKEWKEAVRELNEEVLTLVESYPGLLEKISNDNGVLTIATEDLDSFYQEQISNLSTLRDASTIQQVRTLSSKSNKEIEDFSNQWGISKDDVRTAISEEKTKLSDSNWELNKAFVDLTKALNENTSTIELTTQQIGVLGDFVNYAGNKDLDVNSDYTKAKKTVLEKYGVSTENDFGYRSPDFSEFINSDSFKEDMGKALGSTILSMTKDGSSIKFELANGGNQTLDNATILDRLSLIQTSVDEEQLLIKSNESIYEKFGAEWDDNINQFTDANGKAINSLSELTSVTDEQRMVLEKLTDSTYNDYMSTLYGSTEKFAEIIANNQYNKNSEFADREAGLTAFKESQRFEGLYGDKYQSFIESLRQNADEDVLAQYNNFETIEDFTNAVKDGTISLNGLSEALDKLTPQTVDLTHNINGNEFTNRIDFDEEGFDDFLKEQDMSKGAFNRMARDASEEEGGYYDVTRRSIEELIDVKQRDGIVTEAEAEEIEKLNSKLEGLDDAAKDTTAMILRMSNGVVKLREKFEDISTVLSDDTLEGTVEWYEALDELDQGLSEVLNIDAGTLSDTFLESGEALDYARRMAEGDMTAIDDLRRAASEDIVQNLTIQSKEGEDVEAIRNQLLAELSQLQTEIDAGTITVTTDLDDKPFIDRLNELLANSQITAEQASNILSSMGVDAHIGHAREEGYVQAISYHPRFTGDALEIGENGPRLPGIEMVPEVTQLKTDIDIPYIEGAHYTGSGVQTAGAAARNPSFGNKSGGKGSSPKKGGGGKGKNTKPKDYKTSEWDYLTDITNDLNRAAAAMEKLTKLEDRLYGADKISNLKKLKKDYAGYINLLQKEVKLAERHAEKLKTSRKDENGNLTVKGLAKKAGMKLKFDKEGNIENGREIEIKLLDRANKATEQYNKHRNDEDPSTYEDAMEKANKDYSDFLKAYSEYEDTLGKIEEGNSQIQEYFEKLQDAADEIVDSIQQGVDDLVDTMTKSRDFNRAYRNWQEGGSGYSHFGSDVEYYSGLLGDLLSPTIGSQSVFDVSMENLQRRKNDVEDVFDMNGKKDDLDEDQEKLSQAQAQENLKEATDSVVKTLNNMIEYYDQLLNTVREASAKMDELIEDRLQQYDDIEDFLDTRLEQIELLFGENYAAQAKIYNQKINTNMSKLTDIGVALEAKQVTVKTLEDLEEQNKELSTEQREELKAAKEEVNKLQKEQLETETALLKDIQSELRANVSNVTTNMINEMFGGNDIEWLSQQWELATRNSEQYLDDYNRAFELQKLQLKYQDLLNNTQETSLAIQQRISDHMNDQLGYLQTKKKYGTDILAISEYDVKYAEKQLEILQKQIALEEARDNKSQMRLQRNAAGNYDFVYAADEDAVAKANADLLNAQQEAYNMSKQMSLDTYESAYQAALKAKDMIVEVAMDATLSTDEQMQRIQYILDNLQEYMVNSSVELDSIAINLYNDFIEAEALVSEKNLGNLNEIFEQLKILSTEAFANMEEDLDNYKNSTESAWDYLRSTGSDTLNGIKDDTTEIWKTIGSNTTGVFGEMGRDSAKIWDDIAKDAGLKLEKIRMTSKEKFLDGSGDNASIKNLVSTALTSINQNFGITQTKSIANVTAIQNSIKGLYTKITGTYLPQYKKEVEKTLETAGDRYDTFINDSLKRAQSETERLNETSVQFKDDLDILNGIIFDASKKMKDWKDKIKDAWEEGKKLVTQSLKMQEGLEQVAIKAALAADELERVKENSDIDVSIDYTTTYTTYHNDVYSSTSGGGNSGGSYGGSSYDSGTTSTPTYWAVSDSNGLKAGKKGFTSYSAAQSWARSSAIDNPYIYQYDTGGYTGVWSDKGMDDKNGKLALLHQKELVLNAHDTENMLSAVEVVRDIMSGINASTSLGKIISQNNPTDIIEQRVEIQATFPGVTEAIEIKQALEQLADNAYQVANKYKY